MFVEMGKNDSEIMNDNTFYEPIIDFLINIILSIKDLNEINVFLFYDGIP
jgi:hypothetical protein